MRPLPYREVARKLAAAGFAERSQRGSHVKFIGEGAEGRRIVVVPRHREVSAGALRGIIRQAGLTTREFELL